MTVSTAAPIDDSPPPDEAERERIRTDLDATLFVEAGAGAGKTSSLVARIVNLVRSGVPITGIAAITFTEKAAAELRSRTRQRLERRPRRRDRRSARSPRPRPDRHAALVRPPDPLRLPDRGRPAARIHRARRTRERPRVRRAVERPARPAPRRSRAGRWADRRWTGVRRVRASSTGSASTRVPAAWPRTSVRTGTSCTTASSCPIPARSISTSRRSCGSRTRSRRQRSRPTTSRSRPSPSWSHTLPGCAARVCGPGSSARAHSTTSTGTGPSARASRAPKGSGRAAFGPGGAGALEALRADEIELGPARPPDPRRASSGTGGCCSARSSGASSSTPPPSGRASGQLEFHDLLVLARRLLTDHAHIRRLLHERYERVLLDEFQDTDPIQLEIAVRLTADPDDPAQAVSSGPSPRPRRTSVVARPATAPRPPVHRRRPQAVDLPVPACRHRPVPARGRSGRRRHRARCRRTSDRREP